MPELCSPVPFSFFWGVNEPRVLQQALILSACIWDVGRFFVRAAIFQAATHPTAAYSISEVMAYHQREREILLNLKHPLSPGFAAESESMDATMLVREQAGEARRRRIQWALLLADVIWLALWFTVFGMRRPWGFLIAGPVSGLSYVGLSACPLPEDPAKRRLNAVMIAHYLCAVGVFTGFILSPQPKFKFGKGIGEKFKFLDPGPRRQMYRVAGGMAQCMSMATRLSRCRLTTDRTICVSKSNV